MVSMVQQTIRTTDEILRCIQVSIHNYFFKMYCSLCLFGSLFHVLISLIFEGFTPHLDGMESTRKQILNKVTTLDNIQVTNAFLSHNSMTSNSNSTHQSYECHHPLSHASTVILDVSSGEEDTNPTIRKDQHQFAQFRNSNFIPTPQMNLNITQLCLALYVFHPDTTTRCVSLYQYQ